MKNLRFTTQPDALDGVIDEALTRLKGIDVLSDDYAKAMSQIEKLQKFKEHNSAKPVSRDTLAIVAGNLAGIMLILSYERAHVITTKALGVVMKPR
jgi:hypothetical protein